MGVVSFGRQQSQEIPGFGLSGGRDRRVFGGGGGRGGIWGAEQSRRGGFYRCGALGRLIGGLL